MSGEKSDQSHLGPYRLLTRSGGGPGTFRAADGAGRDVAITTLPPDAPRPDVARMRAVLSPYVVDVLDGDADAGTPYVVSRFVPGRTLGEELSDHGALRGGALRRLAVGLAKGLAAIHRAGLAHGALDTGSVLLVDGAPVIVEFGLVPGTAADDVHAWAATVTFAATFSGDAVPAALEPLLRAATAPDPAARPSAAELAEAVAALDLGPEPAPVPAPRRTAPDPVPVTPAPAAPVAGPPPTEEDAHALAVALGWSRLLTVLVVVVAVGITLVAPVVGLVLTLLAVTLLRLVPGGVMGLVRTLVTLPYAAAFAVAVPLALVSLTAVGASVAVERVAAFGAGAATLALWAAPGVRAPRRRLEELFMAVAVAPRWIAFAGVTLGLLAFAVVVAAMSWTPSFAPMYGLQSSLEGMLSRLQIALH